MVAHHIKFWSLNACRIVYVIDEETDVKRFGFAYGTLADHAERGEERFTIEWNLSDDSVWYDILAFSQANKPAAKLGYPITRMFQRRFARDSMKRMTQELSDKSYPQITQIIKKSEPPAVAGWLILVNGRLGANDQPPATAGGSECTRVPTL